MGLHFDVNELVGDLQKIVHSIADFCKQFYRDDLMPFAKKYGKFLPQGMDHKQD